MGRAKHLGCDAVDEAEPEHAAWRIWVLFFKKQELQLAYKAMDVTNRDV